MPLPTRGSVLGGFLRLGFVSEGGSLQKNGKIEEGWSQPVLPQGSPTSRDATLAEGRPQDQSDQGDSDNPS